MKQYKFNVLIPEGLHARPCAKMVEILEPFKPVIFCYLDKKIEVLSILELLMLKISYGAEITICLEKDLPEHVEKLLLSLLSHSY